VAEDSVRNVADAIVKTGMKDAGYQYVVSGYRYQGNGVWDYSPPDPFDNESLSWGDVRPIKGTEAALTDYFEPSYMGGSDYSGGSVEVSNHKVFLEEFGDLPGVHEIHGDFDMYGVAIRLDCITPAVQHGALVAVVPKLFQTFLEQVGFEHPQEKVRLFETAASKDEWVAAYCAAVIAVNTTCRSVEIRSLRWRDLDLVKSVVQISRSKNEAGHRLIPLNDESLAALSVLRQRAELLGDGEPDHFVFPSCEHNQFDFTRRQKSWRTAWRNLTETAGLKGFRFHDLRHQAITELAE